jgi:cytochrome P460
MRVRGLLVLGGALVGLAAWLPPVSDEVPYPDGYREWAHIKSAMIPPNHPQLARSAGFTHIYANPQAREGYRTRVFPEGSVIAFDWLTLHDSVGSYFEGPRRQLDVMVKDSTRFAATGGWGFTRFVGESRTERSTLLLPQQCFACHQRMKQDGLVLSRYRP